MRFFASGAPPSSGNPSSGAPSSPGAHASPTAQGAGAEASPAVPHPPDPNGNERRLLEILSPLSVVVGFSSMLADVGDDLDPEARHRYATRVRDAAETLQRMMGGLVRALEGKTLELGEEWGSSGTFRVARERRAEAEEAPEPAARATAEGAATPGDRPRVFILDADETNRELLAEFLAGRGYELVLLGSGEEAMAQAARRPPDLLIIDPRLPREDGFQLARALKASHAGGFVPLVFVTALADDVSRMRALDVGAEQMLQKPVSRHELRARVKSLLQLRAQQEALATQNAQLRSLQRFKEETTAMLVHDLKSPLSAMMMNLDFALDDLSPEPGTADVRTALAESRAAGAKLFRMIANLLDIARSDDGRLVPKKAAVDVDTLFKNVGGEHAAEAQARKVTISIHVDLEGPILADVDILGRVLANLVENALRYTSAGGHIVLAASAAPEAKVAVLTVTNDGRPIAPDWRPHVFEKYASAGAAVTTNRGLGLYFCRVAAEAHGGRIELLPDQSAGTCFRIELPQ